MRECTKEVREKITEMRDEEIVRLSEAGLTKVAIAEAVGCNDKTVGNILKVVSEKRNSSEIPNDCHNAPLAETDKAPWDGISETGTHDDPPAFFSEEECDATPAINPADASRKPSISMRAAVNTRKVRPLFAQTNPMVKDEDDKGEMDALRVQDESLSGLSFLPADVQIRNALSVLAEAIKTDGSEAAKVLKSLTPSDAENIAEIEAWLS